MADQDNPAWPTADDDRGSAGFPQVDADKSKPGEQLTTPMPMPEPPRAKPMRIEPGKPPKPAQLKSDPPGGATTWFESPGEPPRAMPMRIEPTGKPKKATDETKPVTAQEKDPAEVSDAVSAEEPATGTAEAPDEADVEVSAKEPVEETVVEETAAAVPDDAEGEAEGADEKPTPEVSDEKAAPEQETPADAVPADETAADEDPAEDVPGDESSGESPDAASTDETSGDEAASASQEDSSTERTIQVLTVAKANEGLAPDNGLGAPVEEPASEQTVRVQQVETTAQVVDEQPAAEEEGSAEPVAEQPAGEEVSGEPTAPEPPAGEQTVQVLWVERTQSRDEALEGSDEPSEPEPTAAESEPVGERGLTASTHQAEAEAPGGERTVEVEQVAVEPEAASSEASAARVEPVGTDPAGESTARVEQVAAEPAVSSHEPVAGDPAGERTAQVEQVAKEQPAKEEEPEAPSASREEPPSREPAAPTPEPEKPRAVEDRDDSGDKPEPVAEKTVQMLPVAKPSAPQRPDESAKPTKPADEKTHVWPAASVGDTKPVSQREPEGSVGEKTQVRPPVGDAKPGGLARPEWPGRPATPSNLGDTKPVGQRGPEGLSRPATPAEPRTGEPVGEKTMQVRPVQKSPDKAPDSWFSMPTRSQPTAPPNALHGPPPNRPNAPKRPEDRSDVTTPTRSQPMPPPGRPNAPQGPNRPSALHGPPPQRTEDTRNRPPVGDKTTQLRQDSATKLPTRPEGPRTPPPVRPKAPMGLETSGITPTRSHPMPPPPRPRAPMGPEKPPQARPQTPAAFEKRPAPETGRPQAPEKSARPQAAPEKPDTQPAPSNEDTQRSLPPVPIKKKARNKRLIALVAVAAVIALGAGVVFAVPTIREGIFGEEAEAAVAPPPAPVAFTPNLKAPSAQAPMPTPQGVQSMLAGPASNPALGTLTGTVIDAATGNVLWEKNPTTPLTPASTTKVLTASAALLKLPHSQQFSTKVVAGKEPGSVIIVGGGDATLNSLPAGKNSVFPGSARLDDLVAQVKAKGPVTQVYLDRTRYTGDDLAPGVLPGDVGEGYISPITPLMMDGARADPTKDRSPRSPNPPRSVATEFAKRIGATMAAKPEVTAPPDAQVLGEVKSAPLTELVDQFLQASDNVLADVIAREVTKATGAEPSFAGLHTAVLKVLSENGFDVTGAELSDGSGMSTNNKSPARLLAQILAVAAGDGKDPRTTKLRPLLGGLPVAGGSGTLAGRFGDGQAANGKGWVRAKTGTLPLAQINSLAGVVLDSDGRLLVFALMTSQSDTLAARPALDAVAATLRSCGCK